MPKPLLISLINSFAHVHTHKHLSILISWAVYLLLLSLLCLPLSEAHPHEAVIRKLISCGFNPLKILDVGANKGTWTAHMKMIFPSASFLMIEGHPMHAEELANIGNVPFEIALVAEVAKNVTFHEINFPGGTGNSIYAENSDRVKITAVSRPANTIDSIMKKHNFFSVDFIKLDIQGAELIALNGATETIKTVDVIISEVAVMNYNQGAPTFFEYISYMNKIGFAFFSVLEMMHDRHNNEVFQMDVVFVRMTSKYWDKGCTGYPRSSGWQI